MANHAPTAVALRAQRRHRHPGTGPPAIAVIAWATLSDPGLRSALELAAASAESSRHRVYTLRRRLIGWALCLGLILVATRVTLWAAG